MRGQLSAEMLILIVVVLAVIAIAASQLIGTAKKGGQEIENQTDKVFGKAEYYIKSDIGEPCPNSVDDDCKPGLTCNKDSKVCE